MELIRRSDQSETASMCVQSSTILVTTPASGCNIDNTYLRYVLSMVVNTVSTVLHQYGVYHVDVFYCEVHSLFFRTVFSSELCLKKFILAIGEIKSALELQLQSLFTT